jgi:hypothetical protein
MNELFVAILAILFSSLLAWGFRKLPGERWQFLAAIPLIKGEDGRWRSVNLTYYGLFSAIAYVAGVALLVVLTAAVGAPLLLTFTVIVLTLAICVPASRYVALWVEGKNHGFTVAGAVFVGVIVSPIFVLLVNRTMGGLAGGTIPMLPMIAAMGIAYTVGEGLGRLGCISFGCCYGRQVSGLPSFFRRLFENWSFEFLGDTKKIAYAGGLAGVKVVPVQAMTAVLYVTTALVATWLFLHGRFMLSLAIGMSVTQIWRIASEFLRADYRGDNKISAYQFMAAGMVIYTIGLGMVIGNDGTGAPNLVAGIAALWQPAMLIFLQVLALVIFIYTGRSEVTESDMSIHVCHDRV